MRKEHPRVDPGPRAQLGEVSASKRAKHRIVCASIATKRDERTTYDFGQQNLTALVALGEHAHAPCRRRAQLPRQLFLQKRRLMVRFTQTN